MIKLHSENEKLKQKVVKKEIYIQELIVDMEEAKSGFKEYSNLEKIKEDGENQLHLKEEEIVEIKKDLKRLERCHSENMEHFHKEKIKHCSKLSSLENEFETQKRDLLKQIRRQENELEVNTKETQSIIMEKIILENKISNFDEFKYEAKIEKLQLDLKRSKIILKDAQNQLVLGNDHFGNRKLINQMKNQIEEVESERNSAIKAKKNLEE